MKLLALERLGGREKGFLLAMACVCLLFVLDLLFVRPMQARLSGLDSEIDLRRKEMEAQAAVLSEEAAVAHEYESVRGMIGLAPSTASAVDEMKGEIDELARKNGVVLQSMEHREGSKSAACQEFLVEIGKCESGFQDLLRFIAAVQDSQGLLRVERVTMAPAIADRVKGSILISKAMIVNEP